MRSSQRYPWR